jgi:outer membrane protein
MEPSMNEQKLVKLYMNLTGSTESAARSVLMYLPAGNEQLDSPVISPVLAPAQEPGPRPESSPAQNVVRTGTSLLVVLLALGSISLARASEDSSTNRQSFITSPLTLADAVNLALHQNPAILRAKKDLEATQGIVVQTRAIVVPKAAINGSYAAQQNSDLDTFQTPTVSFGNSQNWSTQFKVTQSLYEGGRMLSSVRTARLLKEQSLLNYQTAVSDTVLSVQLVFYDVLLAAQQITVEEASVQLLTRELADTTRRFEAGTVPRFNVLRAEVELANEQPKLISARNNFRISKNNLANLLGFDVPRETLEDIPLNLAGKLDDEPYPIELPRAINLALDRRTELGALRKAQALRKEDVVTAKAGYRPSLQGFAGYDVHNTILGQDLTFTRYGWIAGAQLSWNIFDGLRTQGRIVEARANYERAGIELDDQGRRIELEVRTSHSNFIQAREVIESQKKVVEEAEEAVRLAQARAEAGTGTQLDVLSAQTALTQARTTQVQALHDYDVARAKLQRAIGEGTPE